MAVALCSAVGFAPVPAAAAPAQHHFPALPHLPHMDTADHPKPRGFISVCLPSPAGLSGLTWHLSGFTLRWLCFIEGWDIKSYEQRVLWGTCSSLKGSAMLCQLSVLLKTNVTLIYNSPNWSWKEFGNYCLL